MNWEVVFTGLEPLKHITNVTMDLYNVCLELLKENYKGNTVRQVSLSISNLVDDNEMQLDLFNTDGWEKKLGYVFDQIRNKFRPTALLRAQMLGTSFHCSKLVGGHKK